MRLSTSITTGNISAFLMKSRAKKLLDSGIQVMMSAVETYNNPKSSSRTDNFATFAIAAWEKLFKAKWLKVRSTNDPDALPIQLTEVNIRNKYPWDHAELTQRCRTRYSNFKTNKKFYSLIKPLKDNSKYTMIRLLDPSKQTGTKKSFFNPNILQVLDKHYTR